MQRAAVRRTAVLDPGDLAQFQAQQQQHHLQQQQQAQGSQGMIAVGHPAAHAASMSMRGSFPHNSQEGHIQHPEPGFRYAGTQGTQDPYRRIAPRPPPGTVAPATNGLPNQRPQQQHAQSHQGGGYGSPLTSTGAPMTTAQYNAYLAASNAIPGGHPTPRALVQLNNQTAAAMQGQRPMVHQQQQPVRGGLPPQGLQARSPAMVQQAGQPLHIQRAAHEAMPGGVMVDGAGMSAQIQPVYRVASQPQLRPPAGAGQPALQRPGIAGQRSVSQNQVPQARPRTIDLSPNTQSAQPQPLQHAYASALQQQQLQQQMQAAHSQQTQQSASNGRLAAQKTQHQSQQQQPQPQPLQPPIQSQSQGQYVTSSRTHPTPTMQAVPTAQGNPPSLPLDTQAARQDPGTPGPISAVFVNERRRSMSAQTLPVPERRASVSPAVMHAQAPIQHNQSVASEPTPVMQVQIPYQIDSHILPQYPTYSEPPIYLSPEDPFSAYLPPNAMLQPSSGGPAIPRLLQLGDRVTAALAQPDGGSIDAFVRDFYSLDARVKFDMSDANYGQNRFTAEVPTTVLARFCEVMRDSGAVSIQLLLQSPREYTVHATPGRPTYTHYVECSRMSWLVEYKDGTQNCARGLLRATFEEVVPPVDEHGRPCGPTIQIRHMEYTLERNIGFVKRSAAIPISPTNAAANTAGASSLSFDTQGSDDITFPPPEQVRDDASASPMKEDISLPGDLRPAHSAKRKRVDADDGTEGLQQDERIKAIDFGKAAFDFSSWPEGYTPVLLPKARKATSGVSDRAFRILEIAESVDRLGELMSFSQMFNFGALESLQRYGSYCIATGAASAEGLYSPSSVTAVPPSTANRPMNSPPRGSGSSPPAGDPANYAAAGFADAPPPSAPLPSIPRMHPTLPNGLPAAFSMPNSPAELLDSSLLYRSNTLPASS